MTSSAFGTFKLADVDQRGLPTSPSRRRSGSGLRWSGSLSSDTDTSLVDETDGERGRPKSGTLRCGTTDRGDGRDTSETALWGASCL